MTEDIQKQIEEMNKQVVECIEQGRFQEGIPLAENFCELSKEHFGEEHPDYAKAINCLAILNLSQGQFSIAEPLYLQAKEIRLKALGAEHPDYAASLNNLGLLYKTIGNFAASKQFHIQAAEILRKALGEEHPNYAMGVNNLGGLYWEIGDYAAAEPLYLLAKEIWSKTLGEEHPFYTYSLNNLAILYCDIGDYSAAEPLYLQTIEIRRKTLGEEHPDYAISLRNLAILYINMENYSAVEPLLLQAKEIRRKTLGEKHRQYAESFTDLAALYKIVGNYKAAEPLLIQGLALLRETMSEEHPNYARVLSNLANLYYETGDYSSAEPLYRQVLGIWQKAFVEEHPDYTVNLEDYGKLCEATGRKDESLHYYKDVMRIHDHIISRIFSFASDHQRLDYLKKIQPSLDAFLSLVVQSFSDSAETTAYTIDLILRRKAIVAEALAAQRDAVHGGKYPELKENLKELTMWRNQIALKEYKGPGPEGKEHHDKLIAEWTEKKEKLESELARKIPEMNLEERLRQTDRRAVAMALPKDSLLIEFVKYNEYDFKAIPSKGEKQWKPARYLTFVLSSGEPDNVTMLDLGEAEPIDMLIKEFRKSILDDYSSSGRGGEKGSKEVDVVIRTPDKTIEGVALREAVFDKFTDVLRGCKRLLISPDGDLSRLPFEVLPLGEKKYLIDYYKISYLSVGRDVLRFGAKSNGKPESAIVIADPDFDMGSVLPSKEQEVELGAIRSWKKSRDFDRSSLSFERLPGTRPESERISNFLNTKPLLDDQVLEGKIKSIHSPFVMHLATHGFFLEDQKIDPAKETGMRYENPLLRSGLALAGANTFIKGGTLPDEAEDGILTAEDVSGLDLLGTELVVLSACDTGLGEVRTGEGVFGLRRSFMLAGAKTLIMSLWKVTDLATPILMERFYDNLLNKKLARDESLREAQLYLRGLKISEIREKWLSEDMISELSSGNEQIRNQLREFLKQSDETAPFTDPLYWGAFICQGDVSPII